MEIGLSPNLFNIYMDEIIMDIKIRQEPCSMFVFLFVDDLVIIVNDEKLQRAWKISVRTKIVIDNYILELVSHFNYLGVDITYEIEGVINKKLKQIIVFAAH